MPEDTRLPFFNFCNPDCQMCLMWVINLIGWITVPFFNATFCHVLDFPLTQTFLCLYRYTPQNYIILTDEGFGVSGYRSIEDMETI